jgi:hypothetical protein
MQNGRRVLASKTGKAPSTNGYRTSMLPLEVLHVAVGLVARLITEDIRSCTQDFQTGILECTVYTRVHYYHVRKFSTRVHSGFRNPVIYSCTEL